MKEVMRKRYYCDHCKKSGGHKYWMVRHENHCTNNPDRECRMCTLLNGGGISTMKELVAAIGSGGEDGLKRLREAAQNCPACMLAAIRQSGVNDYDEEEKQNRHPIDFNYQQERKQAFDDIEPDESCY